MHQGKKLTGTLAVMVLFAAVVLPLPAETADEKVIRTGAGAISAQMMEKALGTFDVQDVPAALIPSGCIDLVFFVIPDPAAADAKAVLLAGRTAKGDMKALARLEYPGGFHGKGVAMFAKGVLTLVMEYPYSTAFVETRWSWDGKAAKLLGSRESDPQKGAADSIRALIKKGDLAAALKAMGEVMYPDSYLDSGEFGPLLAQLGHKKALAAYRGGKSEEAAKILSGVFLTDQAAGLLDVETADGYRVSGYDAYLPFADFVEILNDYGFFLEEISDSRSVKILSTVVALAPDRAVAFLNLADAQWKAGRRADAASNYREYSRLMKAKGFEKQIPSRVAERSAG